MYSKSLFVLLLCCSPIVSAQDLAHYRPVAFQNPLLQSGQYIFSAFYNNGNYKTEQVENNSTYSRYGFTTLGYLGITDAITLSSSLSVFPKQTTFQYNGNSSGQEKDNFNLRTEIALSYRLQRNFEFWGTAFYSNKKTIYSDRISLTWVPVGIDPNTGELVIEQREVVQLALPDSKYTSTNFRIGLTFVGSLW